MASMPSAGFIASELVGAVIGLMLMGWLLRGASEAAALRKKRGHVVMCRRWSVPPKSALDLVVGTFRAWT